MMKMKNVMRLRNATLVLSVLPSFLIAGLTVAQDAKTPTLPDKSRADIREIQLRMVREQSEYSQLQNRMMQIQENFRKEQDALQAAQKEACKAAGIDCDKDWSLDMETLKFSKKPEAPKPAPKPKS